MDGYDSETYGERFAEVYDDWYADISDVDGTVDRIASLAGDGRVLELGCGTGRLLIPLAQRGIDVIGLDASEAMLDRLSINARSAGLPTPPLALRGDMASFDLSTADRSAQCRAPFRVVFAAFNTFFNLTSESAQRSCLASVANNLTTDGQVLLECFLPSEEPDAISDVVDVARMTTDRVVLRVTRRDPIDQSVSGQMIDITEDGGIRLRPWQLRYATTDQLDQMAADAGLVLLDRWGTWAGGPVTHQTIAPVSRYGLAT